MLVMAAYWLWQHISCGRVLEAQRHLGAEPLRERLERERGRVAAVAARRQVGDDEQRRRAVADEAVRVGVYLVAERDEGVEEEAVGAGPYGNMLVVAA